MESVLTLEAARPVTWSDFASHMSSIFGKVYEPLPPMCIDFVRYEAEDFGKDLTTIDYFGT